MAGTRFVHGRAKRLLLRQGWRDGGVVPPVETRDLDRTFRPIRIGQDFVIAGGIVSPNEASRFFAGLHSLASWRGCAAARLSSQDCAAAENRDARGRCAKAGGERNPLGILSPERCRFLECQ